MDKKVCKKIIELSDLPKIPLYMDQVLMLLDEALSDFKRNDGEKILTKTMINNYTKDKLLHLSKNKKYDEEHMALLILIYHLKTVISIADIQRLFYVTFVKNEMGVGEIYNSFLHLQKNIYEENLEIEEMEGKKDCKETVNKIFSLLLEAEEKKRMAEKLIDSLKM